MIDTPEPTPEGKLIGEAATASGRSIRSLAADAGMSDARWRQVVKGWQPVPGGARIPVKAPPLTLARMASTVGLSPDELTAVGREDAAQLMPGLVQEPSTIEDPAVFLVVHDGGLAGVFDEERARQLAIALRGVVVRCPVVADFRHL